MNVNVEYNCHYAACLKWKNMLKGVFYDICLKSYQLVQMLIYAQINTRHKYAYLEV